uniref:Pentatricopeptide repeat-containing protein n=1 Tax=Kalanchoe fedtschenkoi TaxID=63787 RepID=A0A7N0U649_KALFE
MSFIPATKLLLRYSATATATATYVEPSTALIHCLQLAIQRQSLKLTQQSHAQIMCWKLHQNPFIVTKLIISHATCQNPGQGEVVFGSVREKNVYLWNTLINGYMRNGEHEYAFQLFSEMCEGFVCPDDFTFSTLCKISGEVGDIGVGKYVHGKCFRTGIALDVVVANSAMSMYLKCGSFCDSLKVFDEMPVRNLSSWNVVVNGEMCEGIVCPDDFTFSTLCKVSGEVGDIGVGKYVHGKCFRTGIALDVMTKNADKWKDRIGTQRKMVTEKLQKRAGNIKDRKEQKRERKIAKREKKLLRPGS